MPPKTDNRRARGRTGMALGLVTCAIALGSVPAIAQTGGLEEIVVSARFREENLQKTPLAITAFTGASMEERNLTDVTQLDAFSPNTVIQPLGAGWGATEAAFIRGVGLGDNSLSFEPGVPIYIDDVYFGRPQGALFDLLDLERVEILRGPQGTLFGKNAIGGTIRMVSRKPKGDNTGSAEVTTGSFNRLDVRGSYDISLVPDKLFARFSASSKQRDGYFKILDFECVNGPGSLGGGGTGILPGATHTTFGIPLPLPPTAPVNLHTQIGAQDIRTEDGCVVDHLGDENVQSARAAFRWVPNDKVDVNFVADITLMNQEGPSDKYTYIDPNFLFTKQYSDHVLVPVFGLPYDTRFITNSPYTGYQRFGSDPLFNRDVQNVNKLKHTGFATTVEWDISDKVKFKSITSYRDFENTFGRDSDGSPLPIDHTWDTSKHNQTTQEFQFTGTAANGRLDWATGLFHYDADDSNQGWNFLFPFILSTNNSKDVQTTSSSAVFFHATYSLTDILSLSAGVRYTDDQKDVTIYRQDFVANRVIIPNTPVNVSAKETSPKIGLNWQLTPTLMTYVQYATGFRGGGFGPRPANPLQVAAFGPEEVNTLEGGVKTDLRDGKLRVNSTLFFSESKNQQQGTQEFDSSGAIWFRTVNTGRSEYRGLELEILSKPVDRLEIDSSVGYIHYDRVDPGVSGLCRFQPDGSLCPAPRTPEWTAAVGVSYEWPLRNGGSLSLRGDANYQSKMFFGTDPINGFQDPYTLVDARLTWRSPDRGWSIALFGTNLTDEVFFNGKLSLVTVLGREQGNTAPPRELGVALKRSF